MPARRPDRPTAPVQPPSSGPPDTLLPDGCDPELDRLLAVPGTHRREWAAYALGYHLRGLPGKLDCSDPEKPAEVYGPDLAAMTLWEIRRAAGVLRGEPGLGDMGTVLTVVEEAEGGPVSGFVRFVDKAEDLTAQVRRVLAPPGDGNLTNWFEFGVALAAWLAAAHPSVRRPPVWASKCERVPYDDWPSFRPLVRAARSLPPGHPVPVLAAMADLPVYGPTEATDREGLVVALRDGPMRGLWSTELDYTREQGGARIPSQAGLRPNHLTPDPGLIGGGLHAEIVDRLLTTPARRPEPPPAGGGPQDRKGGLELECPVWDEVGLTLRFEGRIVLTVSPQGPHMRQVLFLFQSQGWPEEVSYVKTRNGKPVNEKCRVNVANRLNEAQRRVLKLTKGATPPLYFGTSKSTITLRRRKAVNK